MSAPRYARLLSKLLVDAGESVAPPPLLDCVFRPVMVLWSGSL